MCVCAHGLGYVTGNASLLEPWRGPLLSPGGHHNVTRAVGHRKGLITTDWYLEVGSNETVSKRCLSAHGQYCLVIGFIVTRGVINFVEQEHIPLWKSADSSELPQRINFHRKFFHSWLLCLYSKYCNITVTLTSLNSCRAVLEKFLDYVSMYVHIYTRQSCKHQRLIPVLNLKCSL